jgi:glutathione S-transferase
VLLYADIVKTMSVPELKPIIFYDIPSVVQNKPWSPNTMKTRYCLTFKGLPFQTVWLEYPQIKPFYEQHSLVPTTFRDIKGIPTPVHTLPIIMDPNTNRLIADSFAIAQYLDEQYPDTPKVLPNNTAALVYVFQTAFYSAIKGTILLGSFRGAQKLNPESKEYYIRTREERFGIPWEQFATPKKREEQWNVLRVACNTVDGWYAISSGQFIMGDTPCFADFMVAGLCKWIQNCFENQEWEEVKSWNGGRWRRLVEATDRYLDYSK